MSEFRFLLDENMDPALRRELLKREPVLTIWAIGDPATPSKGSSDPEILRWCQDNSFTLITKNRASMPRHLKST